MESPDIFLAHDLATVTPRGYPAERLAPMQRQNIDYGPVVSLSVPFDNVRSLLRVTHKTISKVEGDYWPYHRVDYFEVHF